MPNAARVSVEAVAPFRNSAEQALPVPATVTGNLPSWLQGELVRTCPAVFQSSGWSAEHWFDGLGLLYKFSVDDSAGVSFRSKLIDSAVSRDAFQGKTRRVSFGTQVVRSPLQRLFEPIPGVTDNTNVNVLKLGNDLIALTEGPHQLVIDPTTLSTQRVMKYEDALLPGASMSAHPHFDFERQRVVNVAFTLGPKPSVSCYEHEPNQRQRSLVGTWNTKRMPYVHTFGLTPTNAILIAHPFSVNPLQLLWSNRGFIDHFKWQPQEGTRLIVIDRQTGAAREHVTDAFFVFHAINAFERNGETVLDVLAYPDAKVVESFRLEHLAATGPELRPIPMRITMQKGVERARAEKLSDLGFEFPATNYRRANGQDYRYAWGGSNGTSANGYTSKLVKLDVHHGTSTTFSHDDYVFGEPVFVAQPNASEEDAGVLLSVGTRQSEDVSALVVVDANSMQLVAKAVVPVAIPLGFHGSFMRKAN